VSAGAARLRRAPWRHPALALAAGLLLGTLFICVVARPLRVAGSSMAPVLADGDVVATLVVPGAFRLVEEGDLVVARRPAAPRGGGPLLVKRVARIGGGTARPLFELAGDNEKASEDSRTYGPVPAEAIEGLVLFRLYPRPFGIGGRERRGGADRTPPRSGG